jgi:hypothetical protein
MRKRSTWLAITLALVVTSCTGEQEDLEAWSRAQYKPLNDSIGKLSLGCYREPAGFFILEYDAEKGTLARKLTYRKGFPLYIDTLSYIKPNEFRSKREDVTYLLKDTCVLTIQYVKIFHPNSNQQGQSPWIQPYVNTYKRIDK